MAFFKASTPPPSLRALFAAQQMPACYLQGGQVLAFANPAFEALWDELGLGPLEDAVGQVFPPPALAALAPLRDHVASTGTAVFRHGVLTAGPQRWDVHALPFAEAPTPAEGTMMFFIPASPEATDLAAVVEHLADGVLAVAASGEIRLANAAARRMLGLSAHSDLGTLERLDIRDLAGRPVEPAHMPISRALRGEEVASVYLRVETPQGERVLDISAMPLPSAASGRPTGVILLHDITEVYRLRDSLAEKVSALEAAFAALQELDRLKGDFLNTISHELRTPLSTIVGYVEFLEEGIAGPLTPSQAEYLGWVAASAAHLLELINDLLDVTALQAGRLRFSFSPFQLDQLVTELLPGVVEAGQAKGIAVTAELARGVPLVNGDYARTRKVIAHLVDNALKFTPAGGQVKLVVAPDSAGVRLEVIDTGIGIPLEAQDKLFTMFFQVESGLRRAQGGAGLGLYVSKLLVEAQHGQIGVNSAPGAGTRVWFTLPAWDPQSE